MQAVGQFACREIEDRAQHVEGEASIFPHGDRGFDDCHAVEIAQEIRPLNGNRVDAFVAQLTQESPVSDIERTGDAAQVFDTVIGCTAVDMVNRHAFGDSPPGSHPDGVCSKDAFFLSERMSKIQVMLLTSGIVQNFTIRGIACTGILHSLSSVGKDFYAVCAACGGIEGDAGLGARTDIAHLDVVAKERRLFVGNPFDLKCRHSSQGFVHRRHRRR